MVRTAALIEIACAAISMPGVQMPHCAPPATKKCFLKRREFAVRCESLDREDVGAVDLTHRHETRVDDLSVDDDRARAALALAAAFLCAGQAEILAQRVEQPAHARAPRAKPLLRLR